VPAAGRSSPSRVVLVWLAAVAVASVLVLATGYQTRDADSRVYVTVAARLATAPAGQWIAPQWWGAWERQGLFREHPIGIFVLPALLAKAGVPAAQAPYVIYFAIQAACCLMLVALAGRAPGRATSHAIVWAVLLIPIAFVFRVRANQEYALLLGLLVAVYGIERSRDRAWWVAMALAGFIVALVVKGVFGLLAPVYAALWLLAVRSRSPSAWIGVAAMVALAPVVAVAYERAYVAVTGESFLDYYLGARLGLESAPTSSVAWGLDKAGNALWYLGRLLWYAAPWSLVLLVGSFAWTSPAGRSRGADAWVRFSLSAVILTVGFLALRDTKADRYIFPAYFLAACGGLAIALDRAPRFSRLMARVERTWPWGPALLWLLLVAGRVILG
jgi:hypothetical protein